MMKPFNSELFMELCEKYGVEFSNKYDEPVIEHKDGSVTKFSELTDSDLHTMFFGEDIYDSIE